MCWPNYFFRTALTKNQDFCRTNSKFHDSYRPEFFFITVQDPWKPCMCYIL